MRITSLFRLNISVYNLLLLPKIIYTVVNNKRSIGFAKKNKCLKDSQKGTLYICGNGPSLRKVDFKNIKDDYLVLNDYYRFENKNTEHPPKYYMVMDNSYLEESLRDRFNGILNPGFKTTYVMNGLFRNRLIEEGTEIGSVIFFCPWGKLFSSNKVFDFSRVHGRTWNVVSEAILFGIYLGYKDIRLLGCDYSVFATNEHFYANSQEKGLLGDLLYTYCYSTHVHYEIAKYAKKHSVNVINMTRNTLLDAYPIDYDSPY